MKEANRSKDTERERRGREGVRNQRTTQVTREDDVGNTNQQPTEREVMRRQLEARKLSSNSRFMQLCGVLAL